jgi:hypothetical protein
VWDTKRGRAISSLQLHIPILNLEMSTDSSRIAVHLLENRCLPIVCLHNTPATYVKMPIYVAPAKEIEGKCARLSARFVSSRVVISGLC